MRVSLVMARRVSLVNSSDYTATPNQKSEKELSVKLAFHIKAAKIDNVKTLFLDSPAKKEYDPTVDSIGMIA